MRRFEDRVALVTGAASGIGRATALRLAGEGARLLCADLQRDALEATAKSAAESGTQVEARVCDVSSPDETAAAVAACVDRFGRLDALCNVAGILRFDHSHELGVESWQRVLAVNLTGTFLMCRAALPHLLETGGAIVNTSSTAGLAGLAYGAAYSASKAGVLGLTRSLAVEYGKRGVRVNAVCPGSVATPMSSDVRFPEGVEMKLVTRMMALDRPRGPELVAALIALLASDEGAHINGEEIRVDGGTLA